jgi:membrane protein YqaA with SNARE-associated domain
MRELVVADPRRDRLRLLVVLQLVLLAAVAVAWALSPPARERASLALLFAWSIPCEFLVSLAPHEPAVLWAARAHAPWLVAAVAGAGTLAAEALNWEVLRLAGGLEGAGRIASTRMARWIVGAFGRAPFAALTLAGFVPVIPFTPMRALVMLHRYPRGRYLAAAVGSRTARFYLVALAGAALDIPGRWIALLFAALALGVTLPGVLRLLSRRG